MANPEHLKILLQGIEEFYKLRQIDPDASKDTDKLLNIFEQAIIKWNKWRRWKFIKPDLSNIDLHGPNASGLFLQEADLSSTNFSNSNLSHALLRKADISHSNLSGADLSHASLTDANFTSANLSNASLRNTRLMNTNFMGANLRGTDFTDAELGWTMFLSTDLSEAKGLGNLLYAGPGFLDIETIYRSTGKIPELFLQCCDVPDEFITYTQSLIVSGTPIQFYSCFISYSSPDRPFAERLHADLQNKGVRCWYAPEDMKIGDKIRDRIDESIRLRDKLLLILSEHSIASEWVEHEVESALEDEKQRGRTILFPIRLDDVVMESGKAWAALIRRTRHIGDFTQWKDHDLYQNAFDRLLRDLEAKNKC